MTWAPLDLADIADQIANGIDGRPVPTVLARDDGAGLFYPGKVNGIHGESGSGKTWLALLACMQELAHGHRVIYVDHEGDPRSIVARLFDLGVTADTIVARFLYVQPDEPFADGGTALLEAVRTADATLVVIDSTGEGLSLDGANPNADDDVARWFREMPRRVADTGPAVILLDHTTKASSGDLWPIGSQRKRAAITGAQVYMETLSPFSRDHAGAARLKCAKDRHGHHRYGEKVGILHVTPDDDGLRLRLEAPDPTERATDGGFRPTVLMEKIAHELGHGDPLSRNVIEQRITGKRDAIRRALDLLVDEGHVTREPGPRGAILHRLIRPFTAGANSTPPEPPDLDLDLAPSRDGGEGRSQIDVSTSPQGEVGRTQGEVRREQ